LLKRIPSWHLLIYYCYIGGGYWRTIYSKTIVMRRLLIFSELKRRMIVEH
jgi:hypothetical protein